MKTFFLFFVLSISYLFLSCSYINNTEEQPFGYAWQSAFPEALAMSSLVLGNEVNSASLQRDLQNYSYTQRKNCLGKTF